MLYKRSKKNEKHQHVSLYLHIMSSRVIPILNTPVLRTEQTPTIRIMPNERSVARIYQELALYNIIPTHEQIRVIQNQIQNFLISYSRNPERRRFITSFGWLIDIESTNLTAFI